MHDKLGWGGAYCRRLVVPWNSDEEAAIIFWSLEGRMNISSQKQHIIDFCSEKGCFSWILIGEGAAVFSIHYFSSRINLRSRPAAEFIRYMLCK